LTIFGAFLCHRPSIELLVGRRLGPSDVLPSIAVMQPDSMLLMVQLYNFLRIWGPMTNIFSLLRGYRHCCALFTTVLVCLDHDSLLVMWTPGNLKISIRSTTALSMNGGVSSPPFPIVHDQLLCLARVEVEVVVLAPHCQFSPYRLSHRCQ
jgi:hypothetical protein